MALGIIKGLLDLLFPPRCIFCRSFLKGNEKDICGKCEKELPYTDLAREAKRGEFFTKSVAPLYYEGKARESILRYKFRGAVQYAQCYGKLLAPCIRERLDGEYDLISWVPLSKSREKARGYDQAMLLALATALELDNVAVETLRKTVDNPSQSGLNAAEKRRANVLGAYEITDRELVEGKRILLIDDIITTGSTVSECARTLLTAGAEGVVCATLAMTKKESRIGKEN